MTDPRILHVVGARPNFMKAAPLIAVLGNAAGVRQALVHTGQHYDANMSDAFFRDLGLPDPDHHLGVGSGSHAEQTARVMLAYEPVVVAEWQAGPAVDGVRRRRDRLLPALRLCRTRGVEV